MSPLHLRLDNLRLLGDQDQEILDRMVAHVRAYPAGAILQRERAPISETFVLLSGWAMRYQTTHDGDRQILNFLLPGDTLGLYGALRRTSDSATELITECQLAGFPNDDLLDVFGASPRLGAALCWIGGQDERFLQQQVLRLGAMNARSRIAHLLVELQRRLLNAGTVATEAMTMPLTQKLLADALGLSAVHVNRCCRQLEREGLIETGPGAITLLDPEALKKHCEYDARFTHTEPVPMAAIRRLDASQRGV